MFKRTELLYYHHSAMAQILDRMDLKEVLDSDLLLLALHVLALRGVEVGEQIVILPRNRVQFENGEKDWIRQWVEMVLRRLSVS